MLRLASRASEKRLGLSAAQLFVLQKLAETDAASVNELAERTLTHQSSVSVVVRKLVERRLVRRSVSPTDHRQLELALTSTGRSLLRRAPQPAQDRLIAAIRRMPSDAQQQLTLLLEQLAANASSGAGIPPLFFEESAELHKGDPIHGST
jgi:DNA-binding MarR family transcriptional regulator